MILPIRSARYQRCTKPSGHPSTRWSLSPKHRHAGRRPKAVDRVKQLHRPQRNRRPACRPKLPASLGQPAALSRSLPASLPRPKASRTRGHSNPSADLGVDFMDNLPSRWPFKRNQRWRASPGGCQSRPGMPWQSLCAGPRLTRCLAARARRIRENPEAARVQQQSLQIEQHSPGGLW